MLEEIKNIDTKNPVEKLLNSILDTAFNGIMTFKSVRDKKGKIVNFEWLFVNDIAEKIVGLSKDSLIGEKMLDKLPGNEESGLFDKYVQVVETGISNEFEQYYSQDNIESWFKIAAVKLADGFTVTFQDITDLKTAILKAENRENKYQKLFEESIDPIFVVSSSYKIEDANTSLETQFLYPWNELDGRNLVDLFKDKSQYGRFIAMLEKDGRIDEEEVVLVTKTQKAKICLINCVPLVDEENLATHYIGVIRDITRRKQADRELMLAEKLSMTGKLARTIAHEVRNPLTNLSLALEQLKDEIPEEVEDADLYFSIIKRNSERIGKLISDLLNSSKPKELNLVAQPFNIQVQSAIKLVKDRIKLQNIKLEEEYADNLPDIPLDKDQIQVAFLNLFINAIEATKPDLGILKVKTSLNDDLINLWVEDNGKGISEKNMGKLFEPFFTSKKEGTGLGLTTVQNIIHSHRGQITAKSETGVGTTFELKFLLPNKE